MAHFEFVGKDHIGRGCYCPLEECSLDCSLRRELVNKPTNADRIRQMSDEELSRWFDRLTGGCDLCPIRRDCELGVESFGRCDDKWLDWLKSPVEDSHEP